MKVNLTSFIGFSFILLSFLRTTELLDYRPSFVSSIAIAGIFIIAADLTAEKIKVDSIIISTYTKMKENNQRLIKLMEGMIGGEIEVEVSKHLNIIKTQVISGSRIMFFRWLFYFFWAMAVLSIIVLPQLIFMTNLDLEYNVIIGDVTVLLGIGLTLVSTFIREISSRGLENLQEQSEQYNAQMTEACVLKLCRHYEARELQIRQDLNESLQKRELELLKNIYPSKNSAKNSPDNFKNENK